MLLLELREKIDGIDDKILALLNERAGLSIEIGKLKQLDGVSAYIPEREKNILSRVEENNRGPLPKKVINTIYREIFSGCRALELPLKIAYLGPEGTFSHLAAKKKFGSMPELISVKSIADVFIEVSHNRCNYGVVPIESSSEGVVTYTLDMFIESNMLICSELFVDVSHNLLSKESDLSNIKKLYSHPQPFAQTRIWRENNLSDVENIEVSSTAEAAKRSAKEPFSAAIASELAAELYGLNIVVPNIEDQVENCTRFLIIGRDRPEPTGRDKTSLLFSVKDKVGVLHDVLAPFAKWSINLTRIESRPSRKQLWEYFFFVDLNGHIKDSPVRSAIDEVKELCVYLKILGSYPMG